MRPGTREHFLGVLEREWPDELDRCRCLYPAGGAGYLRAADRRRIVLTPEPAPEQLALAIG